MRSNRLHVEPARFDDIREVLSEYCLELLDEPQLLTGKSSHSRSWLIKTSRGKKILKRYKRSVIRPTIIHEHSILMCLEQVDFPCPRLVATRAGKTWVFVNVDHYALFEFIEGGHKYRQYILLPGQVKQIVTCAGKLLAVLHVELEGFTPRGYNPNGFRNQNADRGRDLQWYIKKLNQCVDETSRLTATQSARDIEWILTKAQGFGESLTELEKVLNEANLPRLIIHGDYSPSNLLLRTNASMHVLDFEMARLDWRTAEVVDSLWRFSHYRLTGLSINKMKWFLDAYQKQAPLTQTELQLIPTLWVYLHIRRIIRHWHHYCSERDDSRLTKVNIFFAMMDWMPANRDKLMSALGVTNHRPVKVALV